MHASLDNMPEIILEGKKFNEITTEERLSVLNFIGGIMYQFGLLTHGERKKVFERTQKKLNQ